MANQLPTESAPATEPVLRERPTHDVHRGPDSTPCWCWASGAHQIGDEVNREPAAEIGPLLGTLPEMTPDEARAWLDEHAAWALSDDDDELEAEEQL